MTPYEQLQERRKTDSNLNGIFHRMYENEIGFRTINYADIGLDHLAYIALLLHDQLIDWKSTCLALKGQIGERNQRIEQLEDQLQSMGIKPKEAADFSGEEIDQTDPKKIVPGSRYVYFTGQPPYPYSMEVRVLYVDDQLVQVEADSWGEKGTYTFCIPLNMFVQHSKLIFPTQISNQENQDD